MRISKSFKLYCQQVTDNQLENILKKEFEAGVTTPSRRPDYNAAKVEAERRGWHVWKGERR